MFKHFFKGLLLLGCAVIAVPNASASSDTRTTTPAADKFYRIKSAATHFTNESIEKMMYVYNNVNIGWKTYDATDVTGIWHFTPGSSDGHYYMQNAANFLYPTTQTGNNESFILGHTATEVSIAVLNAEDKQISISNSGNMHAGGWSAADKTNSTGDIIFWNSGAGTASAWYLELIDDAELEALKDHYRTSTSYLSTSKQAKISGDLAGLSNITDAAELIEAYNAIKQKIAAEITFIPVSDESMIQSGMQYVLGVVGTHHTAWETKNPLCYKPNDEGTVFDFIAKPLLDFSPNLFWTVTVNSEYSCHDTSEGHGANHKVLQLSQNIDGTTKAIMIKDSYGLETPPTDPTALSKTNIEFVPVTSAHFPDETLFLLHTDPSSTTNFQRLHGVTPNGSVGYYSNKWVNDLGGLAAVSGRGGGEGNSYSLLHRLYLVIDSDNIPETAAAIWNMLKEKECANHESEEYQARIKALSLPDIAGFNDASTLFDEMNVEFQKALFSLNADEYAHNLWSPLFDNEYYTWVNNIHTVCGEAYKQAFEEKFPTSIVPTLTFNNIEEKITEAAQTALAEMNNVVTLNAIIVNSLNEANLAVTITNASHSSETDKLSLSVDRYNNNLIGKLNAKNRYKWELELNDEGAVLFKNIRTGLYVPAMPTTQGDPYGEMVADKANAGAHQINKTGMNFWIHTFDPEHISTSEKTHFHMHCNLGSSGTDQMNVVAAGNGATGPLSTWIIKGVNKDGEENIYVESTKTQILEEFNLYSAALQGYWTSEEVNAARTALNNVHIPESPDNYDVALDNCIAELTDIIENVWGDSNNKHVIFQFDRLSAYLGYSGSTLNAPNAVSAATVWQLHKLPGMTWNFYLYNPSANKYADGLSLSDNHESTLAVYGFTRNSANYYEIQCINKSGYNFINKTNASGDVTDGLTWYLGPDGGNKLKAYTTSEELTAIRNGFEIVNEVPADKVSATHCVGKYDKSIVDAMTGPVDTYSIYTFFANKDTYPASALYMPTDGDYFRIRATKSICSDTYMPILKWNPRVAGQDRSYAVNEAETNFDYTGTLFLYHDEKLLCADNQLYMINNGTFHDYATSVSDNNPAQIRFVPGHNELGTYQLVMGTNRNLHIHPNGGKAYKLDVCQENYPNTRSSADYLNHNLELEQVTAIPVAIHSDGFGSIVTPAYVVAPSEESGAVAFVAKVVAKTDGDNLEFVEIPAGHLIAPQTHILIKGTSETVNLETVAVPTEEHIISEHTCSDVKLEVAYGRKFITPEQDEVIYVKSERPSSIAAGNAVRRRIDTTGAKFYLTKVEPNEDGLVEIPGGSMVVRTTNASDEESPAELEVSLSDGIPTGIEEISYDEIPAAAAEGIYDLQGRRLAAPIKGINIINGHKTFIR